MILSTPFQFKWKLVGWFDFSQTVIISLKSEQWKRGQAFPVSDTIAASIY
jgi:hypothetical protein